MDIRKILFLGIMGILLVLIAAAIVGTAYFSFQTWYITETAILTHPDGNQYHCKFYRDGQMDCNLITDPEVGGGWVPGKEEP